MINAAWICLLSPLAAAVLITLLGTRVPRKATGYLATLSVLVSFIAALSAFSGLLDESPEERSHSSTLWTWLTAGDFEVGLTILLDPLSALMMLIVSGVGFLIVAYSIGYMDRSDEERRFFAYMSLFVFSMLLLVQAGDLLLLLAGWGLVGLCSYFLIGYDQHRPAAIAAAKKAFIMNAFGDATMALALFLLVVRLGTLEYGAVFEQVDEVGGDWAMTLVALGLLGGAVAKSAQVPLHTWLPDAMEGPTPVSALIHAATMVTAGVYMLVRLNPIFAEAAVGPGPRRGDRRGDPPHGRPDRARPVGHQARHRLLDDVADRLHVPRRRDHRVQRRDVPPDDARLLQGVALPRRRHRHPRARGASRT